MKFLLLTLFMAPFMFGMKAMAVEPSTDSIATIKQNLGENHAVLVDVREPNETAQGYISGATLLPLSMIQKGEGLSQLPTDKILYIYCRSGRRALLAGNLLEQSGSFTPDLIRPLPMGFDQLVGEGFETAQP